MNKKNIYLIFFVTVCLFFSSCSKNEEDKAKKHLENAKQYIKDDQLQNAAIELKNVIALKPKNDHAHYLLGKTYLAQNDNAKAFFYYRRAVELNPMNVDALLILGQFYIKQANLNEARNCVRKVREIIPENIKAYHLLAGIQIKERNIEAAILTMEKAVLVAPKDFTPHMFLSHLYHTAGKNELAKAAYLKTIALDSSQRAPYYNLSKIYIKEKQWKKTEDLLNKVILTPGIKEVKYADLARFYEHQRKLKLAEDNYLKSVALAPEKIDTLMNLAEFYVRLNQKNKAIDEMNKALLLKKESAKVLTGLAQIYFQFKNIAKAEICIEQVFQQDKMYLAAMSLKGRILVYKKNFSAALDEFSKILSIDPYHVAAFYYKAICIREKGGEPISDLNVSQVTGGLFKTSERFEEKMVKDYLRASTIVEPGFIEARMKLAEIYLTEKDLKNARREIEQILSLNPRGPMILLLLSQLTFLEGDVKNAENFCMLLLNKNPEYGPGFIQLGIVQKAAGKNLNAIESFKKALQIYSGRKEVIAFIIDLYRKNKQYEDVLEILNGINLAQDTEQQAMISRLKGEVAISKGKDQNAIRHFKKAIELAPAYVPAYMSFAQFNIHKKQLKEALFLFEKVLEMNPSYIPALMGLGYLYDIKGMLKEAREQYRKILTIDPEHINAVNNLAFNLSQNEDTLGEALSVAKQAKQLDTKNPNVLDTVGWIYYKKENYNSAVLEFTECLKIDPENPIFNYHIGLAHFELKEYEIARDYFQKAIDIDPDFPGSIEARLLLN